MSVVTFRISHPAGDWPQEELDDLLAKGSTVFEIADERYVVLVLGAVIADDPKWADVTVRLPDELSARFVDLPETS